MKPEKIAFLAQKYQAANRNIPFKFTFEQWCAWWETNLGPNWFQLRGRKKGQYVMARNKDKGPYAVWNIKCILSSQNSSEMKINGTSSAGERHWGAILTEAKAIAIKQDSGTLVELSKKYKIGTDAIRRIKSGDSWSHLSHIEATPFKAKKQMHKRMSADDARKIFQSTEDVQKLANEYGVSRINILMIKRRASWREATKGLPSPPRVGLKPRGGCHRK